MAEYHKVIGIDLGTTYSVVAAYSYAKSDIKVIPNRQNEPTTPSVVYISNTGQVSVGKAAKEKMSREPGNDVARKLKDQLAGTAPLELPVTTLREEKRFNTFFRLGNPEIIAGLRQQFPELPAEPAPREVFVALRALRNKW